MSGTEKVEYESLEKYRRRVSQAQIADLMARITGTHVDLVSYDEVAKRIKARQQVEMGTQMVPLANIVGSVGTLLIGQRTTQPIGEAVTF